MTNLALPIELQAAFWGGLSGMALVLGALLGYFFSLPQKVISLVMAFGSGVLISALAFDLVLESSEKGHLMATCLGFILGAAFYSGANFILSLWGARKHKNLPLNKSANQQASSSQENPTQEEGSGSAIALGALLDGLPESAAIGVSLIGGNSVAIAAVIAIFISNIPEGLSSTAQMKSQKRPLFIFGMWLGIALASMLAALMGYSFLSHLAPEYMAATMAFAAGAVLAMIMQTMIPEAYKELHNLTGLLGAFGFIIAFFVNRTL